MRIEAGEHLGVVVRVGVIVQLWHVADPPHLPVAADLQKRGIEPEEGLVTTLDMIPAGDEFELVPDQFLVGDSTALRRTPTPKWASVESDQAAVGEFVQTDNGVADGQPGGVRHPLLAGDPDAPQSVQDDEVGVGSTWLIHQWALRDSNPRLLPCKGSALAN